MTPSNRRSLISDEVLSVSGVNTLIKGILDDSGVLRNVRIRGEISNYRVYPSGHHYFSIKDSGSVLSCVMFSSQAHTLRFVPENGINVIVFGSVSVYVRDGKYQCICDRIVPDGAGALTEAFEKLKKRLSDEGLFDATRKKPLPRLPKKIAIVTSPSGAAVRDIVRILNSRWPLAEAIIVPVSVQGASSAFEISEAVSFINRNSLADLIIVGRGGGSIEDLWSFNEELVARAIFASEIPVISAVGHEPDVTISDYVSDKRASTPSNAAEIAVPDMKDMLEHIAAVKLSLERNLSSLIKRDRTAVSYLSSRALFVNPNRKVQYLRLDVDHFRAAIDHSITIRLNCFKTSFVKMRSSIDSFNPKNTLERGFSVVLVNGHPVSSINELVPGLSFKLQLADGDADCVVNSMRFCGEDNEK